jgi:hypothetical protein
MVDGVETCSGSDGNGKVDSLFIALYNVSSCLSVVNIRSLVSSLLEMPSRCFNIKLPLVTDSNLSGQHSSLPTFFVSLFSEPTQVDYGQRY